MNKESQVKKLLKHLKRGESITIMESYSRYGITSLHRRLSDLKEDGHQIESRWLDLPSGKRVKEYFMTPQNPTP